MITSSDSVLIMIVQDLYPAGIKLEKFSADNIITNESRQSAETRIGVDGKIAAGWIPAIKTVTINLEADSPSLEFIENIIAKQDLNKKLFEISLDITIPSVSKVYSFKKGYIHDVSDMSNLANVLDPREFTIHFESVEIQAI